MDALKDIALKAGLTQLPPNLPYIFFSFAFFSFVHLVAAPALSLAFFEEVYGPMSRKGRNNWCIHIVSQVHVLVIIPLALWTIAGAPELVQDKAFGWSDERIGLLSSVACGYFIWDMLDAVVNFTDFGFVVHGFAALAIFTGSFRPFVAYFTSRCILWEISTFFLNIHWFLDKTNRTGSQTQLINGICLIVSFFLVRIVYGGMYMTPRLTVLLWNVKHQIPWVYTLIYLGGNTCLQCLNILWFSKMIQAIQKRFPEGQAKKATDAPRDTVRYGTMHSEA